MLHFFLYLNQNWTIISIPCYYLVKYPAQHLWLLKLLLKHKINLFFYHHDNHLLVSYLITNNWSHFHITFPHKDLKKYTNLLRFLIINVQKKFLKKQKVLFLSTAVPKYISDPKNGIFEKEVAKNHLIFNILQ